jgi:hypothetical protein
MSKLTALQHLGLAFETTYGTAVVPTVWLPVNSVKPEDEIKKIQDEGRRANLSKVYQVYDSVTSSKTDIDMDCYPDALGYFLKAILGQDTVTGTNPNYTHTFKIVNALAPSLTLSYFNALAEHNIPGSLVSELQIKFDTEGVVSLSIKCLGQKSAVVTTTTPTYSTTAPFMGWGSQVQIGGVSNTNVVGGEITIKRDIKLLYGANNTQQPTKYSSGRIEIGVKLTFDVEDETELAMLGGTDKAVAVTLNQNANTSVAFQFNLCDVDKASIDTSQEFARVDMQLTPIYNTTDAGLCTITLKNQVATY